jgi:hypothetical protein
MTFENAQEHILEYHGLGWLNLVEILYENKPDNIEITDVYQKWAGLYVNYTGANDRFEELTDAIYLLSRNMCEVCGKSAQIAIIDNWEIALCKEHIDNSSSNIKLKDLLAKWNSFPNFL